jgi:hypothetical protein
MGLRCRLRWLASLRQHDGERRREEVIEDTLRKQLDPPILCVEVLLVLRNWAAAM